MSSYTAYLAAKAINDPATGIAEDKGTPNLDIYYLVEIQATLDLRFVS